MKADMLIHLNLPHITTSQIWQHTFCVPEINCVDNIN